MADTDDITEDTIDLGAFVPETFKGEDGKFDTEGFRAKYDELTASAAEREEAKASLPKEPGEYGFALADDHVWPEGFDPSKMKTTDDDGNEVEFDPSKLFDADDPDIPLVQGLLHELGAPASAMSKIAGIMANREIRQIANAEAAVAEEKKALGPDAQARIDTVTRTLNARMEAPMAKAVLDSLTSADALRGIEKLIKSSNIPPQSQPGTKPDFTELSPAERVLAGINERKKRRA